MSPGRNPTRACFTGQQPTVAAAQTTTGRVVGLSGYNSGIRKDLRLAARRLDHAHGGLNL
ncbi:hypothetical protein GCM10009539_53120 [Cryptosporangium japonicum]|uniref:Uncharacterized protein n=1 Tax=Cryptosporangium japonicum TaxID=80872 RepID=A0ABN0UTG8_9ACTN